MNTTGTTYKIKNYKKSISSTTDVLKRKWIKPVHYIRIYLSKKGIKFVCENCANSNGYTWKVFDKMIKNPILLDEALKVNKKK